MYFNYDFDFILFIEAHDMIAGLKLTFQSCIMKNSMKKMYLF